MHGPRLLFYRAAVALYLRIAAVFTLLRAATCFFAGDFLLGAAAAPPGVRVLLNAFGAANLGLALLFWRAAGDPASERSGVYTALVVIGLRAVMGVYEVLYVLDDASVTAGAVDMVMSIALFSVLLNALPRALQKP